VQYALLRLSKTDDGGDSKRVKFVFITWVGENAPAMKKGAVTGHKASVGELFKVCVFMCVCVSAPHRLCGLGTAASPAVGGCCGCTHTPSGAGCQCGVPPSDIAQLSGGGSSLTCLAVLGHASRVMATCRCALQRAAAAVS
jgi:hypothetical protein